MGVGVSLKSATVWVQSDTVHMHYTKKLLCTQLLLLLQEIRQKIIHFYGRYTA